MFRFTGPEGYEREIRFGQGFYSDATPMVKIGEDVYKEVAEKADTMTLWAAGMVEFTTGMFLHDSLTLNAEACIDNLVIPYLPGARQDRVNPTGDVLHTAWSVAEMINNRNFTNVISIDPHSDYMPSQIANFMEYPLERAIETIRSRTNVHDAVIAPDKGAVGRAQRAADVLGLPVIVAEKHRDVSTGHITGYNVEGLEHGKDYLVVDDICDGGMTFKILAESIEKAGAYADLYVTHGIFSKGVDALYHSGYGVIYRTDSYDWTDTHRSVKLEVVKDMETYRV